MFMWVLLAAATLCGYLLFSFLVEYNKQKHLRLPPRPFTIPIIGSVGLLSRRNTENRNKALFDVASKCGGIFRTKIGKSESYVVTSYQLFREATVDKPLEFAARPHELNALIGTNPKRLGIAEGDGSPSYMAYRKFVLVKLRSLGFGQRSMEDCILYECQALLDEIDKSNKASQVEQRNYSDHLHLRDLLCATTANVIFSVLCSKRYEYDDPKLTQITRAGTGFIKETVFAGLMVGFPLFAKLTPFLQRVRGHHQILYGRIDALIQERLHSPEVVSEEEARDFLDIYLFQRQKQIEAGEVETFRLDALAHTMEDLFLGGFETTATTLQWLLLVMLHHPDIKKKIQAEIDEVCRLRESDSASLVTLNDIDNLPFTVATIWEVWRVYPLLPFGVPHAARDDGAKLGGYDIEKDKAILFHIWSIHHDPQLWQDPEKFHPERFLVRENDKQVFKHPDQVVVFSVGRRSCIGEQLARKESFLIFANLMRTFDVRADKSSGGIPELKERPGIIMYPPDFEVEFVRRTATGIEVQ